MKVGKVLCDIILDEDASVPSHSASSTDNKKADQAKKKEDEPRSAANEGIQFDTSKSRSHFN